MLFNDGVNFKDYMVPVKSKLLKEKPWCHFFCHKSHKDWPGKKTWVSTVRGQ